MKIYNLDVKWICGLQWQPSRQQKPKIKENENVDTMADVEWTDIKVKSKVLVTVEDVLPDIIVVSFLSQGKLFQGVLLDSKKK